MLNKIWYDRPIRTQLLIVIGAINLIALVIAGVIWVANARQATRLEMESTVELAKNFARVAIQSLSPEGDLSHHTAQLASRLRTGNLRHVRIFMADADGKLVQLSPNPSAARDPSLPAPAPAWFSALIAPEVAPRRLSIALVEPTANAVVMIEQPAERGAKVWNAGTVVVAGEPADEIAEVWYDVSRLALVFVAIDALVLVALYVALGRVLDPMTGLARGLVRLEDGDYTTRLETPRVKELGAITEGFNRLAGTLGTTRAENARLYGQLISVQENERREIANELHDEASPCLFGIMANTLSAQMLIEHRRDRKSADIRKHLSEILRVTDRLKAMNRSMLKKLRPVSLGHVSLSEIARDLINELQQRYPDVDLTPSVRTQQARYGEAVDLTVYRCIEEGVTNAIRHGKAGTVRVDLFENKDAGKAGGAPRTLQLLIQDDGRGLSDKTPLGFGLTAMRERIHALSGSFALQSAPSQGAVLRVDIPVSPAAAAKAEPHYGEGIAAA